ncbi:MAG: hypothetical protein Q8R53_06475 [Nanoarchaeota archaeon]|nr:hypothetical protein [Nanoarchaeota archaeon]
MGAILGSKLKGDGKVIFEVLMDYEEAVQLQGHMDNVHLFSENISHVRTNISTRGKNSATKYLLIPKELRRGINFDKEISCQKVDLKDRIIFVYSLEKN